MKVRVESEFEGLFVTVEVEQFRAVDGSREPTHHDYETLVIRAQRAVAAAFGITKPEQPFDQDKTQPLDAAEYERRLRDAPY